MAHDYVHMTLDGYRLSADKFVDFLIPLIEGRPAGGHVFPTIDFGLFFALSLALVWSLNSRNHLKKVVLLALSLAFYASWNWRFLLLLLASGVISYLVGLYVDAAAARPFAALR